MWLMRGLTPDHNTIANFRKDNPKAIRKVFDTTVALAKNFDLIGKNQLKEYMNGLASMFLILIEYFKLNKRMLGIKFFEGEFSKWRHLAS